MVLVCMFKSQFIWKNYLYSWYSWEFLSERSRTQHKISMSCDWNSNKKENTRDFLIFEHKTHASSHSDWQNHRYLWFSNLQDRRYRDIFYSSKSYFLIILKYKSLWGCTSGCLLLLLRTKTTDPIYVSLYSNITYTSEHSWTTSYHDIHYTYI